MTALSAKPAHAHAHAVPCAHCGLPVPPGLVESDAEHQFCCGGCRSVFAIIQGGGLTDYYPMRRQLERTRARVDAGPQRYDAFNDPAFIDRYARTEPDGTRSTTLVLEGLHCAACVWLIERLAAVVPGVISASVAFGRAQVEVRWSPDRTTLAEVARGLHALGYPVSPPRAGAADEARRVDARRQLVRIGVAGALAGNIMIVSVALYAGVFEGIASEHYTLFRWVAAGLGLLTLAWPGRVFFRGAWNAVRTRTTHLDLPIAIALAVGGVWGLANTVRGTGEIYFDSLASLVFLLLIGRFVQSSQQRRAAESVDLLLSVAPSVVRIAGENGATEERPVEAASLGDTAVVHAGETFAVDGTVLSGASAVDRSILTGESAAVEVAAGDSVHAGTVNLGGTLRVRIDALGDSTRAARMMRLVTEAMRTKPPIVQLADRAAGWFVVVVGLLAAITAAIWWADGPGVAIEHATALLIVTCPCALGLATPLVLASTIGRLARAGVLVKGGAQLERLARPGTLILDKTGTLTHGSPVVDEWRCPDEVRCLVRSLESHSTHPIAKAIAGSGPRAGESGAVEQTLGKGIRGVVQGRSLVVGSHEFVLERGAMDDPDTGRWASDTAETGRTPVCIAVDGRVVGGVALSGELRPDARPLLDRLARDGWETQVLSGDDPAVTERVAEAVGIPRERAFGRVSPEGKLAHVRGELGRRGPVVMVGDGVNDAAALAAADVGIAADGGADATMDAADVAIHGAGLAAVGLTIDTARAAIGRVRACIAVSLSYNALAAGLAMAGMLHPLAAAVLMPVSSVSVVALAAAGTRRLREGDRCR